jgi:hypothetical protein
VPITNSIIIQDAVQIDGRRVIREQHTDHLGGLHYATYMAEVGADATLMLPIRAALIEDQLAAAEIAANVEEALGDEI